jgi:membrane protease YdiL (CAAX protease family)
MTAPPTDVRHHRIAIVAAPAVLAVMYPVFRLTGYMFGGRVDGYLAWAAGLAVYWLLWGTAFPLWALGWPTIRKLLRPSRADRLTMVLVAVPAAIVAIDRLAVGAATYQRSSQVVLLLLTVTAFGNGFFEELLWRGVYLRLFVDRPCYRVVWPSVWFGLWHVAPVTSRHGPVLAYVVGATLLALYLALIAGRTGGVFWPIVAHTGAALVAIA